MLLIKETTQIFTIFIAVIVVRYNPASTGEEKEPKIMEVQIDQVDHTKDTMHLLKHLISNLTPGIMKLSPK